jgi:Uma2 family endonuclease
MANLPQTHTRMTAAEFLDLPESMQKTELIDGEIIMTPAPELFHQELVGQTYILLRQLGKNGKAYLSPTDVYLDDTHVVQPDVLWVAENGACVSVEGKYLRGAPDLVVEVFSPGSIRYDKITKFKLYEQFGVREYWMIHPSEQYIEVYVLDVNRFVQQGVYQPGDIFTSSVLTQSVDVNTIFGM